MLLLWSDIDRVRRDEALQGKQIIITVLYPALVFVSCLAHVPAEECHSCSCMFSVCRRARLGEIEADGGEREGKARGREKERGGGERDRERERERNEREIEIMELAIVFP